MYEAPMMAWWKGRTDSEESLPAPRWHQRVQPISPTAPSGVALLGVCCDEGVRRNQGRPGARRAPVALRKALAGQAWHLRRPLYDAGNLHIEEQRLEALSEEQADRVAGLLDAGHTPLLLGGGHEIAFGSFLGLARHLADRGPATIGIINFDAHFDLREAAEASSGTPFRQIADYCAEQGLAFNYACLGVSETANTQALFMRAAELGALYLQDRDITPWSLPAVQQKLADFMRPLDALYLSIDLDVLPAATAPGVSAPAPRGVSLELLEVLLEQVREQAGDRLRVADIAEYNPDLDSDGRTARVAARLCHLIAR